MQSKNTISIRVLDLYQGNINVITFYLDPNLTSRSFAIFIHLSFVLRRSNYGEHKKFLLSISFIKSFWLTIF